MAEAPAANTTLTDPRWTRLMGEGLACSCGERHVGLFPIDMLAPIGWPGARDYEPDEALRMDGTFLSANLSVIDGKYFAVRMGLPLPIQGAPQYALVFTVWAALNRPDFEGYLAAMKSGEMNPRARAPARLVNRLGGFPDTAGLTGLAAQLPNSLPMYLTDRQQEDGRQNPIIEQQRDGITLDRLFEIYAEYDHDMRASLT